MTTPLWVPIVAAVVSGIAGIAGALGGAALVQRATREREERQYRRLRSDARRELMRQLYLDMAQHVEATEDWLFRVTDDVTPWSDVTAHYEIPTIRLTPRVELFSDADMFDAWRKYLHQMEILDQQLRNAGPGAHFAITDHSPKALRTRISNLRDLLRGAVEQDLDPPKLKQLGDRHGTDRNQRQSRNS